MFLAAGKYVLHDNLNCDDSRAQILADTIVSHFPAIITDPILQASIMDPHPLRTQRRFALDLEHLSITQIFCAHTYLALLTTSASEIIVYPLLINVFIKLLKEFILDFKRRQRDKAINKQLTRVRLICPPSAFLFFCPPVFTHGHTQTWAHARTQAQTYKRTNTRTHTQIQ